MSGPSRVGHGRNPGPPQGGDRLFLCLLVLFAGLHVAALAWYSPLETVHLGGGMSVGLLATGAGSSGSLAPGTKASGWDAADTATDATPDTTPDTAQDTAPDTAPDTTPDTPPEDQAEPDAALVREDRQPETPAIETPEAATLETESSETKSPEAETPAAEQPEATPPTAVAEAALSGDDNAGETGGGSQAWARAESQADSQADSQAGALAGAPTGAHAASSAHSGMAGMAGTAGTDSTQGGRQGLDTERAAYFQLVRARIESRKKYPQACLHMREQGRVEVGFTIQADGGLSGLRVLSGSHSQRLDQSALEAVRAAAPFPPPPPDLFSGPVRLSVELVYELD